MRSIRVALQTLFIEHTLFEANMIMFGVNKVMLKSNKVMFIAGEKYFVQLANKSGDQKPLK